jgi:NADH:ubiquinone oxidoreductase subunit F (NADH-binding)/ferredoxin
MDRRLQTTDQPVRFRIDATRCDGQGVCPLIAPEVFALDRYGIGYVRPAAAGAMTDPDVRNRGLEASALCPRNAIFEQLLEPVPASAGDRPAALREDAPSAHPSGPVEAAPAGRLSVGDHVEPVPEWVAKGGFADLPPQRIAAAVREAGIRGQGGALFPTSAKWQLVTGEKPVVVLNGSEREPGTVKDRYLLEHRPALVLDGLRLAMRAIGADLAVVAIDADATTAAAAFRGSVEAAAARGLLGGADIQFQEVPPRYVAGEESALIRLIETGTPIPRIRPPYPSETGLHGRPTLVNNVETLANVALAVACGTAAYRSVGTPDEPGSGLFSIGEFGGPFMIAERPIGYPLRAMLDETGYAGTPAVVVGGYAGALISADQFDVRLDNASLRAIGATLGTKSVQVLGPDRCPVAVAAEILAYFAGETAGQCPPCARGLPDMAATLRALEDGAVGEIPLTEFEEFMNTLSDRGVCRLPDGAARLALSLLRHFAPVVKAHLGRGCALVDSSGDSGGGDIRRGQGPVAQTTYAEWKAGQ